MKNRKLAMWNMQSVESSPMMFLEVAAQRQTSVTGDCECGAAEKKKARQKSPKKLVKKKLKDDPNYDSLE